MYLCFGSTLLVCEVIVMRMVRELCCLMLTVVAAAGCGTTKAGDAGGTADQPTAELPVPPVATAAPSVEPTGPEIPAPAPSKNGTSVSLPTLPVGGGATDDLVKDQCVVLGWLQQPAIPAGVRISVTSVDLDSSKFFTMDRSTGCENLPPCANFTFTTDPNIQCSVSVTARDAMGKQAKLILKGGCVKDQSRACKDFISRISGSGVPVPLTQPPSTEPPTTST
jgi:hypothetical protein